MARSTEPPPPWQVVEPKLHVELLQCFRELDSLFGEAGIPYWICGGTLLGAVKHGGFIPHDDDLDLEVFDRDIERVRELCASHPHLHFTNRTRYYDKQFGKIFFHGRKELVIDLFWREDPCPLEPEFLGHEEIFPLRRYDFHDIHVSGPRDPYPYLRRCYGEDCLTHCKVWNHHWNKQFTLGFDKNKVTMPLQDYLTLCASLGYQQVWLADYDHIMRGYEAAGNNPVVVPLKSEQLDGTLSHSISTPNEPVDDQQKLGILGDTF